MSVFYDLSKTPRNILNQAIVRAIVSENNGALFDPSDLSTLYQDAAGTIPVTAVEQPVGKMLDKSGNGYHATQSITASRPALSARYNLLTKTEDFSDAAWTKVGITLSQALGPNGVTGAYKITEDLTTGFHRLSQAVSSSASSCIVYIKNDGANYCAVSWRGNSDIRYDGVIYNLLTKSKIIAGNQSGLYVSDSIVDIGDGWLKITITLKLAVQFHVACANPTKDPSYSVTYTGDGVSGLIVYHPQVSPSVTTPYQRVNTATDYDTDERYFPKYLRFDGVDDYLNLPYMSLYAGGEMSIIAARNAVSQSTDTYIISERSITDADPKYFPSRQLASGGNMDAYISDDAGAVVLDTVGSAFGGAADKVIRSVVDTGSNLKLYKNGSLAADDNYTRAGTLTLNNTTLGASVSTTTGNYASMKLYGLIVTKKALSPAQRVKCERYMGTKAGLAL